MEQRLVRARRGGDDARVGMVWEGRAVTAAEAAELKDDPAAFWDLIERESDPPAAVDLDKAWHGIHWLLTGEVDRGDGPLAAAIMGGQEFGEDNGYGPPRLLSPSGVTAVASALGSVDLEDLRARYGAAAMSAAGLYPEIWEDEDNFDDYLAPNLELLKQLYEHAAAQGCWVLQALV